MNSKVFTYKGLNKDRLDFILENIKKLKVALLGDVCLDVYWQADMTKSELSRETPHFPLPIIREHMSPGAGGNVAANLASIGAADVKIVGIIGDDWRGSSLRKEFAKRNINTDLLVESKILITNAYCKPMRCGISDVEYEDPRLDFTNYLPLPENEEDRLLEIIDTLAKDIDVICVTDQFVYSCITKRVRDKILELTDKGIVIVADSRDRVNLYKNVILKPNDIEGCRAIFGDIELEDIDFEMQKSVALKLSAQNNCNVCMTLGGDGCLYVDDKSISYIPTISAKPPIDICGAGDTFIAAFACALATGVKGYEACAFANISSSLTVKKIGMTGTSTPDEIKIMFNSISDMT